MMFYDIHTHNLPLHHQPVQAKIIYNLSEEEILSDQLPDSKNVYYSCGIHPWYIEDNKVNISHLRSIAKNRKVVAIGEAGLDALIDTKIALQEKIFVEQIKLAEELQLPLIIHCVKAWHILQKLHKQYQPSQAWIIHGFRRGTQQAKQLADEGFYLSIGQHYNKEALSAIPMKQLLIETDDATIDIREVYNNIASDISCDIDVLSRNIEQNVSRLFDLNDI